MAEDDKSTPAAADAELAKKVAARVEPILKHLDTEDILVEKDIIRDLFVKLWEYEDGENLKPETQYMTTVALFMYCCHNILDDYNIRIDKARSYITRALQEWVKPELDKAVAEEKAADNPFQAFVEKNQPRIDDLYIWENFMLDHKKADATEWNYKMKKCWFAQFFIRFGHVDYIETACAFDKIPWEARKDYVDLKLSNLFAKLGTSCQFKYTPVKK